jgi:endonuclease/exonuclease/phosphatase family metal-dependent hydrolase
MRLATLNVQNMRLRDAGGRGHLDGARDDDIEIDREPAAADFDGQDRRLTARLLGLADADVVALQEVFDQTTLDHFHDRVLLADGVRPYPHRICLPGNDGRGLDVALMSRLPMARVESHADLTAADLALDDLPGHAGQPIFRRDCLEAEIAGLSIFVCHFKAPHPDAEAAWPVRRLEALAVRRLIERRFPTPARNRWIILGDLNEPADATTSGEAAMAPLLGGFACDLLERLDPTVRWTYYEPTSGRYSRPDAVLVSPALAAEFPDARPCVLRAGLGTEAARHTGKRLSGVGRHRPHASDHAALVVEFDLQPE